MINCALNNEEKKTKQESSVFPDMLFNLSKGDMLCVCSASVLKIRFHFYTAFTLENLNFLDLRKFQVSFQTGLKISGKFFHEV